jgi:hypothetical protein
MTAPRNPDDLIRAFLGEGETDLPDRAFEAVRARIHRTHQRVVIGSWRNPDMSIFARVAIATVAVLAVGLAWVNFGPKQPGVGGLPTPPPSPSAAPTPSPSPIALPEEYRPLEPGTYVTSDPFFVRVTFTVPDGWQGNVGGKYFAGLNPVGRPGGPGFLDVGNLYADPCHPDKGLMDPPVGPTASDLANALASIDALNPSTLSGVTVDGYVGTEITLRAPATFDGCTLPSDGFSVWQLPLGANYGFQAGQTSRVFILDVDGKRLVIDLAQPADQTTEELSQALEIIDSIQIKPGQ